MVPDFLRPVKQGDLTGYKVTSVIISHTSVLLTHRGSSLLLISGTLDTKVTTII